MSGDVLDFMKELIGAEVMNDGGEKGENYLPLTHLISDNNNVIKTLARGGVVGRLENRLVVRHFYGDFFTDVDEEIQLEDIYRIYVTGTPGVGKSTSRNYYAWKILRDFKSKKKAVRIALHKGGQDWFYLLCLDADGSYRVEKWKIFDLHKIDGFKLGVNFFALSDVSTGDSKHCGNFDGGSIIFSSPNAKTWQQGRKENCTFFYMPLWTEEELCIFDTDGKFKALFDEYGGVVRVVWGSDSVVNGHDEQLLLNPDTKMELVYSNIVSNNWELVPHRLVYLVVEKGEDGKFQWKSVTPTLKLPTKYLTNKVAKRFVADILNHVNNMLGLKHASVHGILFEAVVLQLIGEYSAICSFNIKRLTKGCQSPFLKADNFLIPEGLETVGFETKDFFTDSFMKTIENRAVLAVPFSDYFPGFDASISFNDKNKSFLALLQITTADKHPLSVEGLKILENASAKFKQIIIIYILPFDKRDFILQELKSPNSATAEQKEIFKKTSQVSMWIKINETANKRSKCADEEG